MDWVVAAQFSPDENTLAISTRISGIQMFRALPMQEIEDRRREDELSITEFDEINSELSPEHRFAHDPGSVKAARPPA